MYKLHMVTYGIHHTFTFKEFHEYKRMKDSADRSVAYTDAEWRYLKECLTNRCY